MPDGSIFDRECLQIMYRYACVLCNNRDDAYDLLQYGLEKFIKSNKGKHEISEFAYLRSIMRNHYIDQYRKRQRFPEDSYDDEQAVAIDVSSLEDVVMAQVDFEIIWKTLDLLEREILYCWAIENMSAQQIAVQLDMPRSTVLSRIFRLRKRINSDLDSASAAGQV